MPSRINPVRITLFKTEDGTAGKDFRPNRLGRTPGPPGLNRSQPGSDGRSAPPEPGRETEGESEEPE